MRCCCNCIAWQKKIRASCKSNAPLNIVHNNNITRVIAIYSDKPYLHIHVLLPLTCAAYGPAQLISFRITVPFWLIERFTVQAYLWCCCRTCMHQYQLISISISISWSVSVDQYQHQYQLISISTSISLSVSVSVPVDQYQYQYQYQYQLISQLICVLGFWGRKIYSKLGYYCIISMMPCVVQWYCYCRVW